VKIIVREDMRGGGAYLYGRGGLEKNVGNGCVLYSVAILSEMGRGRRREGGEGRGELSYHVLCALILLILHIIASFNVLTSYTIFLLSMFCFQDGGGGPTS
jgi:hypothetical protein